MVSATTLMMIVTDFIVGSVEYIFHCRTVLLGTPAVFHFGCDELCDEPVPPSFPVLAVCLSKVVIVLHWGPSFPQGACGESALHLFSSAIHLTRTWAVLPQ